MWQNLVDFQLTILHEENVSLEHLINNINILVAKEVKKMLKGHFKHVISSSPSFLLPFLSKKSLQEMKMPLTAL